MRCSSKDMIFAVLRKYRDRGKYVIAFRCHTRIQSEVENFMLSLGFTIQDYYLCHERDFLKGKNYPYHFYISSKGKERMVFVTDVTVKQTKNGYRFTVIHE